MKALVETRDYPCVAAVKSFALRDYVVGIYEGFGTGKHWRQLRSDLLHFISLFKASRSPYLTFWAVFDEASEAPEAGFDAALWRELSFLTAEEWKDADHDRRFSSDPLAENFGFSLGGEAFFVVGLHHRSSRLSRRFPVPALIFNLFSQFELLAKAGIYAPMVETNRRRDAKLQGSANPMAVQYGELWESIQFSGRENPPDWQCPFRFIRNADKPHRGNET